MLKKTNGSKNITYQGKRKKQYERKKLLNKQHENNFAEVGQQRIVI